MKYAVLGTGMVGKTIATKLISLGHEVMMGSRTSTNEKAIAWAEEMGENATHGTFSAASAFAERIINCTSGGASVAALGAAGAENIGDKIIVDIANPLDFSEGFPPTLSVCNDDSLGEQIQRAFPKAKVVKTLNTVNCMLMVDPAGVPGEHSLFICGDDDDAKAQIRGLLGEFGWGPARIIDGGGISFARGTEAYLLLWTRLFGALGNANFNVELHLGETINAAD